MKYLLIFACLIPLLSCNNDKENEKDPYPIEFSKSYIQGFVDVEKIKITPVAGIKIDDANKVINDAYVVYGIEKDKVYSITDGITLVVSFVDKTSSVNIEKKTARYDELVNKIGDISFNKKIAIDGYLPIAVTSELESIKVTSSQDFNVQYPAGSDLSGLFTACFDNPMEVITNSYKAKDSAYRYSHTRKELVQHVSKGNVSDMCNKPYIGFQSYLLLKEAPLKTGKHSFEITITTKEGAIIKAQAPEFTIKGLE